MLLCVYIVILCVKTMNYLQAKTELLGNGPRISLRMLALEITAMLGIAALMVRYFA